MHLTHTRGYNISNPMLFPLFPFSVESYIILNQNINNLKKKCIFVKLFFSQVKN